MKGKYFTLFEYIVMAMVAAMGIAVKAIVVPLAQVITGPLFIPAGVVGGGFYMAFLVLGAGIVAKPGSASMIALIQAAVVTITGTIGSHGAASLLTYTAPGLAVDLVYLIIRHRACCAPCCFVGGMVANMVGSFAVNLAIFSLSFTPLMLSLTAAALSGGLGGLVAFVVIKNIKKLGILGGKSESEATFVPLPDEE